MLSIVKLVLLSVNSIYYSMNTKLIENFSFLWTDHNYDIDIFFNVNQKHIAINIEDFNWEKNEVEENNKFKKTKLKMNRSPNFKNALKLGTIVNF